MPTQVQVDPVRLAETCRRFHIRRVCAFGSILSPEFRPDSDVDLLVEFDPDHRPGLVALHEVEQELSGLWGRRVDVVNPKYLNHRIRDQVLAEAEVQFDEG